MENIRLAFQGIWGHKMRSFLTMLGIIIGIASIITIVSTIAGTNEQIKQNLIGSGTNVVTVQLYQNNWPYEMEWNGVPDNVRVIEEDTRQELEKLSGVSKVSFYHYRSSPYDTIYYGNTNFSGGLYGVDSSYFSVVGYRLKSGRGFLTEDFNYFRKVAILDNQAATGLFSMENPVGKVLEIKGDAFTVIGVVEKTSNFTPTIENMNDYYLYTERSGGTIFVPDTTWPIIYQFDEPQAVAVRAEDTDSMTKAGKNVADALTLSQIIGSTVQEGGTESGEFSYRSEDLLEQAQQLQDMSNATNHQLIWIASISLLVGGIGVMNIMLVSVTERTGEIGLKKALGAKKRRILWQFLTEAAVLTCLGGLIGVATGIGLAELISRLNAIPVAISIPAIVISVAFSTLIGVVFGLLPAYKAANLNPIEALRRD